MIRASQRRFSCMTPLTMCACTAPRGHFFVSRLGAARGGISATTHTSRTLSRSTLVHAKPNKKLPERTVNIYCSKCRTQLYKYHKNGNGKLVKCWHERIACDYTNKDLRCHNCGQEFARPAMIRGLPANKIIGGKTTMKKQLNQTTARSCCSDEPRQLQRASERPIFCGQKPPYGIAVAKRQGVVSVPLWFHFVTQPYYSDAHGDPATANRR
eukprot:TRINITY_DN4273_c0_g1_i7.p1 TRINITY_DN4273_c0_g1~~TRINITY_DN4273_c0_g1_i7.p1  ORF type:complete len:212 (-),score=-2.83 TRINITY_DN4273_c0_g1_i7:447-1082(-)